MEYHNDNVDVDDDAADAPDVPVTDVASKGKKERPVLDINLGMVTKGYYGLAFAVRDIHGMTDELIDGWMELPDIVRRCTLHGMAQYTGDAMTAFPSKEFDGKARGDAQRAMFATMVNGTHGTVSAKGEASKKAKANHAAIEAAKSSGDTEKLAALELLGLTS